MDPVLKSSVGLEEIISSAEEGGKAIQKTLGTAEKGVIATGKLIRDKIDDIGKTISNSSAALFYLKENLEQAMFKTANISLIQTYQTQLMASALMRMVDVMEETFRSLAETMIVIVSMPGLSWTAPTLLPLASSILMNLSGPIGD